MKEGPQKIQALLLELIPVEMCRQIFSLFSITINTEKLSLERSLMLWKTLIRAYFPYLQLSEETTDPQVLMNLFINERRKYEEFNFRRWGVTQKIEIKQTLLALSGNLNAIDKSNLNESSKKALFTLALVNGHYAAFFKLNSHGKEQAFKMIAEERAPSEIQHFLKLVGKIICYKDSGYNLLCWAAHNGQIDVILWICENYSNHWNTIAFLGQALEQTARQGRLNLVQRLLKEYPKISTSQKETALVQAASKGHLNVVQCLLMTCPKISTEAKMKAFANAASEGHLNVVQCLLMTCPEVSTEAKVKAFSNAASEGHLNVVQCLLMTCPEISTEVKMKVFSRAAKNGNFATLGCLLKECAGELLCKASREGSLDAVQFILERCPQMSIVDKKLAIVRARVGADAEARAYIDPRYVLCSRRNDYDDIVHTINESIERQRAQMVSEQNYLEYYKNAWREAATNNYSHTSDEAETYEQSNSFRSSCILF